MAKKRYKDEDEIVLVQKDIISREHFSDENRLNRFRSWGYEPTEGQKKAHFSKTMFLGLFAGARFGKTMFAANEAVDILLYPGTAIWLCGLNYDNCNKEFYMILDIMKRVPFVNSSGHACSFYDVCQINNPEKGRKTIKTPTGSFLETKSCTGNSKASLFGASLDLVILCEGDHIPLSIYKRQIISRTTDRLGRIIVPTTSATENGICAHFIEQAKEGNPHYTVLTYSAKDNPYLDHNRLESLRGEMDEDTYNQQVEGKVIRTTGYAFPEFHVDRHIFASEFPTLQPMHAITYVKLSVSGQCFVISARYDKQSKAVFIVDALLEYKTNGHNVSEYLKRWVAKRKMGIPSMQFHCVICQQKDDFTFSELRKEKLNITRFQRSIHDKELHNEIAHIKKSLEPSPYPFYTLQVGQNLADLIKEFKECRWPVNTKNNSLDTTKILGYNMLKGVGEILMFLRGAS